jgi:hypothetical protein
MSTGVVVPGAAAAVPARGQGKQREWHDQWSMLKDYFENFRKLSFQRNTLVVFDKLNAPQVQFITRARVDSWFPADRFQDVHVSAYKGVSWRASGTLRGGTA